MCFGGDPFTLEKTEVCCLFMCGIVGFLTYKNLSQDVLHRHLQAMNQTLSHRGPDGNHLWFDPESKVGLGHRRLAIVDLSPAGQQPMVSQCGRWVICYNGETYSQKELIPLLSERGIVLRGHSDTEIMLETCAALGLTQAVEHFIGMFAFALWDRHLQTLYLVRDRLGIKPLYWTYQQQGLYFSSELKALKAHPDLEFSLNRQALAGYLKTGYITAPHTIYQNVYKLSQGHILTFRAGEKPQLTCYWDLKKVLQQQTAEPNRISETQAVEEAHYWIQDSIARRMMADVPLGAFLSGGIDSSLVVSIMQQQSPQPIQTFTIGFHEKNYNEAEQAHQIASYLGTQHTELYINAQQAQAVIPKLPLLYDEPFADVSQIPTFLVSQLARQSVKVVLSGDGGDEVFAGYNRYRFAQKIRRLQSYMPGLKGLGRVFATLSAGQWQKIEKILPSFLHSLRLSERGDQLVRLLSAKSTQDFYNVLVHQWPVTSALLPEGGDDSQDNIWQQVAFLNSDVDKMRYVDSMTYLPDDILVKLDRATMAVGLEGRVPLLDHRLLTWAWQQPYTLYQGQSKWLLRQILKTYIPEKLFNKPKMGFSIPIGPWLRHDLKEWADDLLSDHKLSNTFDSKEIRQKWEEHRKGYANHSQPLWNILMFQAWYEFYRC